MKNHTQNVMKKLLRYFQILFYILRAILVSQDLTP